ncbi:cytochrome c [Thiococcus pfennigii]|uniref:cytochrome c n=1 Tax=Thiococcus pfennigii TaxID=1057 RepID=UPI001905E1AD|nr:cytochrome c [Thiococcus pfennigii]MBK1733265.1 hypothetical protein [Thiococcus pfennigii]
MTGFAKLVLVWGSIVPASLAGAVAVAEELPEDPRTVVEMPPLQQRLLRQEMISHTAALDRIIDRLAGGDFAAAGEVAEKELGLSTMGKHAVRTAGQGPGQFMPAAMRSMGISMHQAATAFAEVAKTGDWQAALASLQTVTSACVTCHAGYRLAR